MRAVSEFMALLIAVGVVVATSIVVATIVSGFMSRQVPSAAVLSVSITYAKLRDGNLYIKGVLVPVGKEPLAISRIEVYKGSSTVSFTSAERLAPSTLYPGRTYEFEVVLRAVATASYNDRIVVVVHWATATGQTGASSASATVSA